MSIDPKLPPNHGQPTVPIVTPPAQYTDALGIASIIMAAFCFTIPGLIFGIVGESKAKSQKASPILSRIGWIVNLIMLVLSIIALVGLFVFLASNADQFKTSIDNSQSATRSMQQTFNGNTFTIGAPNGFYDMSSEYPEASLSISDDSKEVYVIAYEDSSVDIAEGTTLSQYADKAYESFTQDENFGDQKRELLAAKVVPNPSNLEVLDYRMEANYGISKFVYYDRYIKTSNGFYMLTSWTTPGQLDANLPAMKAILSSFKETTL